MWIFESAMELLGEKKFTIGCILSINKNKEWWLELLDVKKIRKKNQVNLQFEPFWWVTCDSSGDWKVHYS